MILISASAPGTTGSAAPQPTYPAVYTVDARSARHDVATVDPLFYDEARRPSPTRQPRPGKTVNLALTDPDSNEVVPGERRGSPATSC